MKKLLLAILVSTSITFACHADPDFSPLIGKSLSYCIANVGTAHYVDTTNFVLRGTNRGPVDRYIVDLGYGYLEIWVNQNQMGTMPPKHIVLERTILRQTGNPFLDTLEGQ